VGHLVFFMLHLAALLLAPVGLFVTLPVHLVYAAVSARKPVEPTPQTHMRCPDCRELVRKDANVCKHCHCKLTPEKASPDIVA
jgi:uncharacterized paraquat-inducible protein A